MGERIGGDAGPARAVELLREDALGTHDRRGIGDEEGVPADLPGLCGAVEKHHVRQVREPRAHVHRVGGGNELFGDGRGVGHVPPFALRRSRDRVDRCVSFTCSGPRSSGGVR